MYQKKKKKKKWYHMTPRNIQQHRRFWPFSLFHSPTLSSSSLALPSPNPVFPDGGSSFSRPDRPNQTSRVPTNILRSHSCEQDAEKDAEDHVTGDGVTEIEIPQHVVIDTATAGLVHWIRGVSCMLRYKVSASSDPNEMIEERRELQRISTCAIFHKFTCGYGVPHTFVGFIRQWPALPLVMVSTEIYGLNVQPRLHNV
jgi:hypothetical protein